MHTQLNNTTLRKIRANGPEIRCLSRHVNLGKLQACPGDAAWFYYLCNIFGPFTKNFNIYPLTEFIIDGVKPLTVTPTELFHSGVDTNRTFYVHFVNAKKSGINGDNFELTAGITTSPLRPGVRCSQVNIEVFGEGSKDVAEVIK
ncbi:MAG: hypothetical protein J7539_15685, partial [Niabella sp.]|nr:hypothetical protein [Niabella sp.]